MDGTCGCTVNGTSMNLPLSECIERLKESQNFFGFPMRGPLYYFLVFCVFHNVEFYERNLQYGKAYVNMCPNGSLHYKL